MSEFTYLDLKKQRKTDDENLAIALNSNNPNKSKVKFEKDTRFWTLPVDKAGNGRAIIRFLQSPGNEPLPFIKYIDHSFKGPGGWYIEKSLTTFSTKENKIADPMAEYNDHLWKERKSGDEARKSAAKAIYDGSGMKQPGTRPRLHYVANIYIVEDFVKGDASNKGKVFLFRFGSEIYGKIHTAMHPEFEGIEGFNPFNFWSGAALDLRANNGANGQRSYAASIWQPCGALGNDQLVESIWKREYSLQAEIAEDKFKTYDQLKKRLNLVLQAETNDIGESRFAETPARTFKETHVQEEVEMTPPWDTEVNISEFQALADE